jgi:hypothetical protein
MPGSKAGVIATKDEIIQITSRRRGPKASVRLGFPIAVVERWFPALCPLSMARE